MTSIFLPGDEVLTVSYELLNGFETDGRPTYIKGTTASKEVLSAMQLLLTTLQLVAEPYPAVSMGKLVATTKSGSDIEIKLIFRMKQARYSEVVYIKGQQYFTGSPLLEIIAQCEQENKSN